LGSFESLFDHFLWVCHNCDFCSLDRINVIDRSVKHWI
jgi:hypothetical protein